MTKLRALKLLDEIGNECLSNVKCENCVFHLKSQKVCLFESSQDVLILEKELKEEFNYDKRRNL